MEFTAKQIGELLKGTVEGDLNARVNKLSKIEEGEAGSLSFLSNPKYIPFIYTTKASVVIVDKTFEAEQPV
jgi:UDP-3-O-[3-hydroxymyristoyl] glucosamine N-acyltransferase